MSFENLGPQRPNGPVAAILLATSIGSVALGLLTTLAEASERVHDWLEFDDGVGPLSGKTIVSVTAFLVAWGGLHVALRGREVPWLPVIVAMSVLVVLGLLGTFPPFFQAFTSE